MYHINTLGFIRLQRLKKKYIKTLPWSLTSPQTETRNICGGKLTIMPWEDRGLYEKYEKIFNQCGI